MEECIDYLDVFIPSYEIKGPFTKLEKNFYILYRIFPDGIPKTLIFYLYIYKLNYCTTAAVL